MEIFEVGPSLARLWIRMGVFTVFLVVAWFMVKARYSGGKALLCQGILVFGFLGFGWLTWEASREGIRVRGETLEVTWFGEDEPYRYRVQDVGFFDIQSQSANPTGRMGGTRRYQAILLSFRDSAYIDIPLHYRNAPRLQQYLVRHGVHQGMPPGRVFRRAY